ncbi:hypothetical protein [Blautia sp.]|uniref:hypothetical protein n=1 Tax=Blautia sp. TaxID=1955243 RepID=UPI003992954E
MKIRARNLIYFQLFLSIFLNVLTTNFALPGSIAYLGDLINLVALYLLRNKLRRMLRFSKIKAFCFPLLILSVSLLIGIIVNIVNPLYVLWGIRNNFRFFLFATLCIAAFEKEDEEKLFNILFWIYNLSFVLALIQFFVLGLDQDFLGGVFGTQGGGNGRLNVLMVIVFSYNLSQYLDKKCSFIKVVYIMLSSLIIAVFAELKFYYIETALIIVAVALFSKPSRKKFIIFLSGIVAVYAGLRLLEKIDPYTFSIVTNFDKIVEYGNMESGGYNISRLSAFSTINKLFFKDNLLYLLFGYGLGNCDTSKVSLFNSEFYQINGSLHYSWFSHQQWFLEGGYMAIVLLVLFMVCMCLYVYKYRQQLKESNRNYLTVFSYTMYILVFVNCIYNNSIRLEMAYITFACLAIVPNLIARSTMTD